MPKKGEKLRYTSRECKRCNSSFMGRGRAFVCDKCKFDCPRCGGIKKDKFSKMCLSCKYELHARHFSGENGTNWRGGRENIRYGPGWSITLKEKIRKRDDYTCQICGRIQREGQDKLQVHHIDFSKDNHRYDNLISLCRKCHSSVHRIYENLVKELLKNVSILSSRS